jgi:hypothetical protein
VAGEVAALRAATAAGGRSRSAARDGVSQWSVRSSASRVIHVRWRWACPSASQARSDSPRAATWAARTSQLANRPHSSATSAGSVGTAGRRGSAASACVRRPERSLTTMRSTAAPRAGQSRTRSMSEAVTKWYSPRIGPGKNTTCVPNSLTTENRTGAIRSHHARSESADSGARPGAKNSQNSTSLYASPSPAANDPYVRAASSASSAAHTSRVRAINFSWISIRSLWPNHGRTIAAFTADRAPPYGRSRSAHFAARASSRSRSRALRVSAAARSNSALACAGRPSRASRSPRTLGSRW